MGTAYDKRGKKYVDNYWEEYGLVFGLSGEQQAQAANDIEYWSDKQMENLDNKSLDFVDWCHRHIVQIQEWLKRNTK